ncbi:MAG TPA: biliverdin-producing heme oxygenase [Drouetiella sp.]|jgi:heme oxygenase
MSTIALQLKESTRSAHNSAEGHEFQKHLGSGTLSKPLYTEYLSQLFLTHRALESAMASQPYMGSVVSSDQLQTEFLKTDLRALGVDPEAVKPLAITSQMLKRIDELAASNPIALLGFHYVLLGSKHGGKFIASTMKKAYGFEDAGAIYFDPYGQEFQRHWQHFVNGINSFDIKESQVSPLMGAASEMFAYVENLGGQLLRQ